jgi:CRISPR-associated protein Cmr6
MSLAYRELRKKYRELRTKLSPAELNIFSAASLASVEYNLERVEGSEPEGASKKQAKRLHEEPHKAEPERTRTEILEWLIKASKAQAKRLCEKAHERLHDIAEAYRRAGYGLLSSKGELVKTRLNSRGLFGSRIFGYTLFEVGLEFDPYLNLPVIPGSSVKGALRSAWKALALGVEDEKKVFGGEGGMGGCVFSDALPIEPNSDGFILYPDVITPHYRNDEVDEREATPKPVTYLSIAPGVKFGFIIGIDRAMSSDLVDKLRQAFIFAMRMGLGAKTSIGYGTFTITNLDIQLGGVAHHGGGCEGALPR